MLPPRSNVAVTLLKDTDLASVVAAPEIMFFARNLVTETLQSMHIYLMAAALYLCMTIPLSRFVAALERARRAWRWAPSPPHTPRRRGSRAEAARALS